MHGAAFKGSGKGGAKAVGPTIKALEHWILLITQSLTPTQQLPVL